MRSKLPTVLDVMDDEHLFGPRFRGESWAAWRVFLKALFGLPMGADERMVFRKLTGRSRTPSAEAGEAWIIAGRRSGKSSVVALIAVYLAAFRDFRPFLASGERGEIMVLAADRKQARVTLRYTRALLRGAPMLARLVVAERADAIELSTGIDIEIHTASFRSTRGYTIIAALLDEIAFWPANEMSANPDAEIVAALRPAMATVPRSKLIGLSSPYARRGVLWESYRAHYGREGDPVLVLQASTRTLNPTVSERVIRSAYEEDEARAAAEFGGEFRRDVEMLFSPEALAAVTISGRRELLPAHGLAYRGFVDPSGGAVDSMTLAIAHADASGRRVLDLVREKRAPFSPDAVVEEFAAVLQQYGIPEVTGDRYGGEWPRERFQKAGIVYHVAERTKSELYSEFLPLVTSAQAEMPDDKRLLQQLARLERRTARSGKDSIDHAPGGMDDVANAAAGALVLAKPGAAIDIATQALVVSAEDVASEIDAHWRELEFEATNGTSAPWNK